MSIEKQQQEFIESLDGDLTPEQAAQLLEMGQGDTGATPPETEAEPAATPATEEETDDGEAEKPEAEQNPEDPGEIDESQLTAENTVILTKDGKHTIEFEKYQGLRNRAQIAEERAAAAEAELARVRAEAEANFAQLQAEARARADAGAAPTERDLQVATAAEAMDQGASIDLFGDFSEEALANGLDKLVDVKLDAKLDAMLAKRLQPIEQQHQQNAAKAHFDAIYTAHPDADSIVESKELADWIGTKPGFAQQQYWAVLEKGSSRDVIAMFDEFKSATGATQQATPPARDPKQVQAAAKKAIETAPKPVPASLSDIPGGRPAGQSRFEQMAEMTDPVELLEHMNALSPEQRQQYLNRYI